jgi:hypothetical protein
MLMAILSEVVNQTSQPENRDVVGVLQLLVLPVVLAALPIILKRNKKTATSAASVAEHVGTTNGHGTLAHMAEQTLIAIGGLRSDIAHLDERLDEHASRDEEYAQRTDARLSKIEQALRA